MGNRLAQVRAERGWKKARLLHELRAVAARRNERLPKDESLSRRVAVWENQGGVVSDFYRDLLCEIYGLTAAELGLIEPIPAPTPAAVELHFLESGVVGTVALSEAQLERTRMRVAGAAEGIRAGAFDPTPGYPACQWCPYRRICPSAA